MDRPEFPIAQAAGAVMVQQATKALAASVDIQAVIDAARPGEPIGTIASSRP